VVVLSQYVAPGYAVALLEHGSAGRAHLLKEQVASVDEPARAIRTVAAGGSVIAPRVVDELVRARSQRHQSPLAGLTPRESRSSPRWPRARATRHRAALTVPSGPWEAHQLDLRQAWPVPRRRT